MGWLIALAVIVLVADCPLGVSARYDENGPLVRLQAGFLRIPLIPSSKDKKKKKDKTKKAVNKAAPAQKAAAPAKKEKRGGSFTDFLPLVQVGLNFLGEFRRKLRVKKLELKLVMAGDDPCDLAVNYGRMNASLAALIAQLERVLVIQKRDVHVDCDFTASETVILARLDLTITLGRILSIAVRYGVRGLMTFLKIKKQREGGADL